MIRPDARVFRYLVSAWGDRYIPRLFVPESQDTMLVSYPKAGNTWVRFLLSNVMSSGAITYRDLNAFVPDIYEVLPRRPSQREGPCVFKSHEPFTPSYGRTVYLVRDPRDVVVSYFHHHRKFGSPVTDLSTFAADFMSGRLGDGFGTWHQHVGGWLGARDGDADFLVLRYEDLLEEPHRHVSRLATFLHLPASEEQVDAAVAASVPTRLRALEGRQETSTRTLKRSQGTGTFVRRASSGYWHEELPHTIADELGTRWAELLERLGYLENLPPGSNDPGDPQTRRPSHQKEVPTQEPS